MAKIDNSDLPRGIYHVDDKGKMYGIQYTDVRGRRRRERAGTYRMAENLLLERKIECLRRKLPGVHGRYGTTVGMLIDDCINHIFSNNDEVAAHDLRLKLERIRLAFGDKDSSEVTRQQISDWLDAETAIRKWKPSSRNRYQSAFSLLFRIGVENGKITTNPAKGIKHKQEGGGRVRFLSLDEEKKLMDALPDEAYRCAVTLAIHTGMRRSEQERSAVGDYDPATNMLVVRQKKNRRGPALRYVPMTPIAAKAYEVLAAGKKPGDPLCAELLGETRWFDKAVDAAGIVDFTWHANRHTFCSRLVMAGVPIAAVAQYAGHASIQMTLRYSHLMPKANTQAIASMMSFYEN